MKKRYDYHSLRWRFKMVLTLNASLAVLMLYMYMQDDKNKYSLNESILATIAMGILLGAFFVAYLHSKKGYIEITDEGIVFQGLIRRIYAPWADVRRIKLLGTIDKIYTANGNFQIRR